MVLEAVIGMMQYLTSRNDDDMVDRMHYCYTPNILIAMAMLVSFKQFGGKPIECMFPSKFPSSWEQYAENFCWAQDTFFLPPTVHVAEIPVDQRYTSEKKLSYYQWVPFFLLFQAACFRLPSLFWKYLSGRSGIRIHQIVKLAIDPNNINPQNKQQNIRTLARHLQSALRFQRRAEKRLNRPNSMLRLLAFIYSSFYVTFIYLVTKCLYLANLILQLYVLNSFLETNTYDWYGLGVIRDILNSTEWEKSGKFPRVSLCDFEVRQVVNIQRYSVQCALVINIFNEKIFIFLWFWLIMLLGLTLASMTYWALAMTVSHFSYEYVSRLLELTEIHFDRTGSRKDVRKFVSKYLRKDGLFAIRMITIHAGSLFGHDLMGVLWHVFTGMEAEDRQLSATVAAGQSKTPPTLKLRNKIDNIDIVEDLVTSKLLADAAQSSGSSTDSDERREIEERKETEQQKQQTLGYGPSDSAPSKTDMASVALAMDIFSNPSTQDIPGTDLIATEQSNDEKFGGAGGNNDDQM